MSRLRANNKEIRKLISYAKDELDSIDEHLRFVAKKHVKPNERSIDDCMSRIGFLLKGIKSELKFGKGKQNGNG